MPFVFLGIGILLLVVAWRGTQDDLFKLVQSEIAGPGSFPVWALAMIVLGAIGYIKPIRPISDGLVLLVLLVIVVRSDNILGAFNAQVSNPTAPAATAANAAPTAQPAAANATPTAQPDAPWLGTPIVNGALDILAYPFTNLFGSKGVPNAQ